MNIAEIIDRLPIDQIAQQLGVNPDEARTASEYAVPALVGGMKANAQDDAGALSLAHALQQHDNDLADGVLDGREPIDRVDTEDGDKIVRHIFGDNREQVAQQLGGVSGAGGGLIGKLMPILAPLVMSYLAKRMMGGRGGDAPAGGSGGMGDILGQVLGGGGGGQASSGGGLSDILGQVLGGGGASRSGGGLDIGDILGGLLGGGRR